MNINVSKLVGTLLFTLLPLSIVMQTTEAATVGKTTHKKNKKRSIGCDSYSKSKLLKKADKYQHLITQASQDYRVSAHLITAVITVESCFRPKARSSSGAAGLMQLMPATARRFGTTNRYNTKNNIKAGTKYLSFLLRRFDGNVLLAAAAYNAGEGAVDKHNGVPPYKETKAYVRKVLNAYRKLSASSQRTAKRSTKASQPAQARTRAWYIKQYEYKRRKHAKRGLNLTTHEIKQVNHLLRHDKGMKPALSFKQFL
ncbi:MAG: lytic transglycosylase domain-containing protein [Thiotrichaceae bacterium]